MTLTPDVLASPVLPILLTLEAEGVRFRLNGDHVLVSPPGALTPEHRKVFGQHRDAVRVLVAIATDAGVQARRGVFRGQLDAAPPSTTPTFLFMPNVAYMKGVCFSCADRLPEVRFARCGRCALAWRLACRLPIPSAIADALDAAKVVA